MKNPFTVPTNEKVTEKHLYRVLLCSVCSILLCMGCLAGTTWAWFTVSIENTGNVIQIAELKVNAVITLASEAETQESDGSAGAENEMLLPNADGSYTLESGCSYTVSAGVEGDAKSTGLSNDPAAQRYVIMTLVKASNEIEIYYCVDSMTISRLDVLEDTTVSFAVSWTKPQNASASELESDVLTIGNASEEASALPTESGTGETDAVTTQMDEADVTEEPTDTSAGIVEATQG